MKFEIPIEPKGQMRARHAVRGKHATTYKAPEQRSREESMKAFLAKYQPETPLEGPLLLGVKAYLRIPSSWPQKRRLAANSGVIRPTVTPDLDNLVKHAKDCLTQMLYWIDDKQVVGFLPHTGKYYSDKPRWEIEIVEYKALNL